MQIECWFVFLASIHIGAGAGASTSATEVLAGSPQTDPVLARAAASASARRYSEAAAVLAPELERYPEDYFMHVTYAYYLLLAGEHARAAAAYRAALALSDTFEAKLGLADALLGDKRWSDAVAITAKLVAARSDDAGVVGRHALALYWLGRYAEAERAYARLQQLAPQSIDAELGLGWTALRSGDARDARRHFERALRLDPNNESARQGLASLGRSYHFVPQGHVLLQSYTDNPTKGSQWGLVLGLDSTLADRFALTVRYRYLASISTQGTSSRGSMPRRSAASGLASTQNEGYFTLAYGTPRFGMALVSGVVGASDDAASTERAAYDATALGLSARWTYWADLVVNATRSFYDDLDVTHLQLSAHLPLADAVAVTAGVMISLPPDDRHTAGMAELEIVGGRFRAGVGGRVGTELRPFDVSTLAIHNVPDLVTYRLHLWAQLELSSIVTLFASGERRHYKTPTLLGDVASDASLIAVGLGAAL